MVLNQTLEVDTWKKTYNSEDKLIEKEGGKKFMLEVNELKYLGFVVAANASKVPNIIDRKN